MHTNIIKATEKHEKTCAIFLDFAKAWHCEPWHTSEETGALCNKRGVVRVVHVMPRKQEIMC